jgi:hypothetical protein
VTDNERNELVARVEHLSTEEVLTLAIDGLLMTHYVCSVTRQDDLAAEIDNVAGQLEIWRSLERLIRNRTRVE